MAFTPKTWVNRSVQYAGRYLQTAVAGMENVFDLSRAEGTIFVEGDKPDATALNDLETRIDTAINQTDTYAGNIYTESTSELQIGENLFQKTITYPSGLPIGAWTTIATLTPSTYKNLIVDFGLSYMIMGAYKLPVDSTSGTSGMIRLNISTGELQGYSASVSGLIPFVRVIYNK